MENDQLLKMLAVQDEKDAERSRESVAVRTRGFDPVLRIAEIIQEQERGKPKFNGRYIEDLAKSFLNPGQQKGIVGVHHIFEDLKSAGIRIPKNIVDESQQGIEQLESLLQRFVRQKLESIPETKVPELPGKDFGQVVAGAGRDAYRTGIGFFLPQNTDALIAAEYIVQSVNGLESVLPRVSDSQSLTRLLFLNQLIRLAPVERSRELLYEKIKGFELSEDALIYVAASLVEDLGTLSKIRKLRGINNARKKANQKIVKKIQQVAYDAINFRARAEDIIYQIFRSTGRVDDSYRTVTVDHTAKETFDSFTQNIEKRVMSDDLRAVKPKDPRELDSGRAILLRNNEGLKRGTIGELIPDKIFKSSKGRKIRVGIGDVLKIEKTANIGGVIGDVQAVDEKPQVGDLVVITNTSDFNGSYGILKKYSIGISQIEFQHITVTYHTPPKILDCANDCFKKAVVFKKEKDVEEDEYAPNVQDRVRIKPGSKYSAQSSESGVIVSKDPFNRDMPFIVKFSDGYQNNYSAKDLEVLDMPATELKRQKERNKKERIKKKKLKVERNRVRRIVQQSLEDIARTVVERITVVKGCVEHLIALGIIPELAHFVVKYHFTAQKESYEEFVQKGVLMRDGESDKIFKRLRGLMPREGPQYERILDDIVQDIQKETGIFIDISKIKIESERDLRNIRGELGEMYTYGYVKDDGAPLREGLVLIVGGNYEGKVCIMDETQICETCKAYHAYHKGNRLEIQSSEHITPLKMMFEIDDVKLVKGMGVRIRRNSKYAYQNKGFGILQEDYETERTEEHKRVLFEDGRSNSYRRKDLITTTAEKLRNEKMRPIIESITPKLQEIFDGHVRELKDMTGEYNALLSNVRSQLESLGFDDQRIHQILSDNMPGYKQVEGALS